jgi:hypothetical protein
MKKAVKKRIIIILIFLFFVFFLFLSLYLYFKPQPSCFDGKQNQNEQGIDCGGICAQECDNVKAQPLIVEEFGIISSGLEKKYDFYARINNPNAVFGSKKFDYTVQFKDFNGEIITTRKGSDFILPREKKYIVIENVDSDSKPIKANLKINNSNWVKFNNYYKKPDVEIINKKYNEVSNGINFAEVYGLLKNNSPYDFNSIKIKVILKDDKDKVVALNSTQMNTINSGEQRDFKLFWPHRFNGSVSNMEVQAEVDIFNSNAFIKKVFKSEKFQQY